MPALSQVSTVQRLSITNYNYRRVAGTPGTLLSYHSSMADWPPRPNGLCQDVPAYSPPNMSPAACMHHHCHNHSSFGWPLRLQTTRMWPSTPRHQGTAAMLTTAAGSMSARATPSSCAQCQNRKGLAVSQSSSRVAKLCTRRHWHSTVPAATLHHQALYMHLPFVHSQPALAHSGRHSGRCTNYVTMLSL